MALDLAAEPGQIGVVLGELCVVVGVVCPLPSLADADFGGCTGTSDMT